MSNVLYLEHHGIKGQRWGVRRFETESGHLTAAGKKRYQNADGTLTKAGKKKISKEYKKAQAAGDKDLASNHSNIYANAYNKSADQMNNGGINKFNAKQEKKYGKDYANRKEYFQEYEEEFNKLLKKNYGTMMAEFIDNNSNYNKAKSLVKQYDMLKWDDLAKQNSEYYDEIHK